MLFGICYLLFTNIININIKFIKKLKNNINKKRNPN